MLTAPALKGERFEFQTVPLFPVWWLEIEFGEKMCLFFVESHEQPHYPRGKRVDGKKEALASELSFFIP